METNDLQHFGLGNLLAPVKALTKKETLVSAAKLGAGAAVGITVANLLLTKVLVRNGVPVVPATWTPLATAVGGVVLGGLAKQFVGDKVATGVVAGTVGLALSQMIARFTSAAPAEVVAAAQQDSSMDSMSGLSGLGRRGFSSLGALGAGASQVYGVGTPDMSAARMFSGTTVGIEETGNPLGNATVEITEPSAFAGILQ
jgi:hypothetical protein